MSEPRDCQSTNAEHRDLFHAPEPRVMPRDVLRESLPSIEVLEAFRDTAYNEGTTSISQRLAKHAADWLLAQHDALAAVPSGHPFIGTVSVPRDKWDAEVERIEAILQDR